MTSLHHAIIGLPKSGKTTFLAAFWHLLGAGEISSRFVLDKLIGDHAHLNAIAQNWRMGNDVPRTSMVAETSVVIHVKESASGRTAILHFPDLSGESYERQLSTRTCATAYVDSFDECGGLMLFVTADCSADGMTISEVNLAPQTSELVSTEQTEGQEILESHQDWHHKLMPTQVCLVELLQFIQQRPFKRARRRVAIMVSAWDVIDNPKLSPFEWLTRQFPFLHQFLRSNLESFDFRVYGVSALGGDLKTKRRELLEQIPSMRIICVGPDTDTHDLTSPIAWLMRSEFDHE